MTNARFSRTTVMNLWCPPRSLPHSSFRFPRDGVVTTTDILLAQMSEAKMSLTVEAFADGIKFDNFSSKSRSNVNTLSELDH